MSGQYPERLDQVEQFKNLELLARLVVEGFITGLHKSPFHGFSVEFAEHRIYNPGESTKNVDWKLYGRTEKLFVKKFEEETNLRSQIVIDTSSSMYFPYREKRIDKLSYSALIAASLIYLLRKQRDAVGLTLFNENVDIHTPSRLSDTHARVLFSELEKLYLNTTPPLQKPTSLASSLHLVAESIQKRSLVVIFSDLMGNDASSDLFSALQHLRYKKHEVVVFHVIDHRFEQQFEFSNRPYRFIDMENNAEVRLNPNDIRSQYQKSMNHFVEELKIQCGQHQIDLIEADINKPFKEVLLPFLVKRSRLY